MNRTKISTMGVVVMVITAMMLGACGGDDGNGNGEKIFKAKVYDRISRALLGGKTVVALDNETGDPIPGQEVKSEADGSVTFYDLPGDQVGFWCKKVTGEFIDTYQFNIKSDAQDEELWLVDLGTYQMAPALAGITVDTSKALVAGGYYWVNAQGEEEPVGCGTVKASPESGEIRYFGDNDLPVNTKANDPVNGRDDVNKLNGTFLIANMDPGPVSLQGYDFEGNQNGSSTVVGFSGDQTILISNVYAEGAANPMPDPCE